jgi:hypothetical protein
MFDGTKCVTLGFLEFSLWIQICHKNSWVCFIVDKTENITFTKVPARRDKIHGVAIDKRETKKSIGEYGPELLGKY